MKKSCIILFLAINSMSFFGQKVLQTKRDTLFVNQTVDINKTASQHYISATYSTIASIGFAIVGFVLFNNANANEMAASIIQPIVVNTQSGSNAHNEYLRTVAYNNGILENTKKELLSKASSQKTLGTISFIGSALFAVKVVISLDKAGRAKYY